MQLTFASSNHIEVSGTTKTYGKRQVENTDFQTGLERLQQSQGVTRATSLSNTLPLRSQLTRKTILNPLDENPYLPIKIECIKIFYL